MRPNELPWLRQLIQEDEVLRVDDLASYTTLRANNVAQPATAPDTIKVCALLTLQSPPTAAATLPAQQVLFFTLRHQPAGFQPPTPDQLFIQTVETIPAPGGGAMINCEEALGG
jgi:hypothetical protein